MFDSLVLTRKSGRANIRASEGSGTTTLTVRDNPAQVFNLSAGRTCVLPTTDVKAGDQVFIENRGAFDLTVQSSGANTIATLNSSYALFEALVDSPTTAANWGVIGVTPALQSDVAATRLGQKTYLHGTTYNGGIAPTVTGQAGFAITRGAFIPYQTQDGNWRLKFNVSYTQTSNTNGDITVNGIAINAFSVGYVVGNTTTQAFFCKVPSAGALINCRAITSGETTWAVAGDFELSSKPTWAY